MQSTQKVDIGGWLTGITSAFCDSNV